MVDKYLEQCYPHLLDCNHTHNMLSKCKRNTVVRPRTLGGTNTTCLHVHIHEMVVSTLPCRHLNLPPSETSSSSPDEF